MKQQDLLAGQAPPVLTVKLSGADVCLYPDVLLDGSGAWFDALRTQIEWRQHRLTLFGKTRNAPRQSAWYGDPDAHYSYSNIQLQPQAWITPLLEIRQIIGQVSGHRFNSVLANLYRSGSDSMGWHADNEKELGPEPVIASVSLGAQRRMRWRHTRRKFASQGIDLPNGSLLLMRGRTQREWQHCVPKSSSSCGARINLTYRFVRPIKP